MTLYEKITAEISANIKENSSLECGFSVDVPTVCDGDIFSNASKISRVNIEALKSIPFVEQVFVNNGFLNFRLKDSVLRDFLSRFEITETDSEDEFLSKLSAYIRLAENEKNLAGETSSALDLTPTVRRAVVLLMKFQSVSEIDVKKARIVWNDIVRLLNKFESESENLKSFVITYEPLLIAARGSLAKLNF